MDIRLTNSQVHYLVGLLERELSGWVRAGSETDFKVMAQHYRAMIEDLQGKLDGPGLELEAVAR